MEVPTSSISAERTFAISRVIDVPNRGAMTWDTFKRELMARVHVSHTETLLGAILPQLAPAPF